MTNHESDELLRQVIDELGEIRKVLAERLPQPNRTEPGHSVSGGTRAVVTGEGEIPSPVAKPAPAKKTAGKAGH